MIQRLLDVMGSPFESHFRHKGPAPEDVVRAYQLLFDRKPESLEVIQQHADSHDDLWSLLKMLLDSTEFRQRAADFCDPRTTLDWRALRSRYFQSQPQTRAGYVTDLLGLHTRVEYLGWDSQREGRLDGLPVAGDSHCSISEWAAALRGVELSGDAFVAVELGAGWGAWMGILCRAARLKGATSTFAIGCEADEQHCEMLQEHLTANGFAKDEFRLFQGAVGPTRGIAIFPVCENSLQDWGMRPVFCQNQGEADAWLVDPEGHADYRGFQFKGFHQVPCFELAQILADVDHVDVMHVDIQGGEFELVEQNLALLQENVGYLVLGTHGRAIEGRLIELLSRSGWKLEVEEPCSFDLHQPGFAPQVDGVQGWRNQALRA